MGSSARSSFAPNPPSSISRRCSLDSSCVDQSMITGIQGRRCSFSTISVREYDQTVGDSPSCHHGAPITLGWKYAEQKSVSLDEFEKYRKNQRRRRSDLVLGAAERRKVLFMNGATLVEIVRAERIVAIKNGVVSIGMQFGFRKQDQEQVNSKNAPKSQKRAKSMISRAACG